jgi:hypothetical protein
MVSFSIECCGTVHLSRLINMLQFLLNHGGAIFFEKAILLFYCTLPNFQTRAGAGL